MQPGEDLVRLQGRYESWSEVVRARWKTNNIATLFVRPTIIKTSPIKQRGQALVDSPFPDKDTPNEERMILLKTAQTAAL